MRVRLHLPCTRSEVDGRTDNLVVVTRADVGSRTEVCDLDLYSRRDDEPTKSSELH
ncbi:hypothetical protein [Curtobacterium sp. MCPF17_011]|uniref:hypothetical protein n=1 Tax=Curtobacterium sp. MCPF17_011 TaxID=2175652 RepID=UPI0015E8D4FF|nr:hypothetical protein [Curtobacterium sp. MCPF17_011]